MIWRSSVALSVWKGTLHFRRENGWIGNGAVRDPGEGLRCKEGMRHVLGLGETRCVD